MRGKPGGKAEHANLSLEASNETFQKVGLLNLHQSRGAVGHDVRNIQKPVTNLLKGGGHVGIYEEAGFYDGPNSSLEWSS